MFMTRISVFFFRQNLQPFHVQFKFFIVSLVEFSQMYVANIDLLKLLITIHLKITFSKVLNNLASQAVEYCILENEPRILFSRFS